MPVGNKKKVIGGYNNLGKEKVLGGTNNLTKEVVIGMVHHYRLRRLCLLALRIDEQPQVQVHH